MFWQLMHQHLQPLLQSRVATHIVDNEMASPTVGTTKQPSKPGPPRPSFNAGESMAAAVSDPLLMAEAMAAAGTGVWVLDLSAKLFAPTPQLTGLLGEAWTPEPKPEQWFFERIHAEDLEHVTDAIQACREFGEETLAVTFRMRTQDGTYRWMRSQGQVNARNPEGNASRLIGVQIDIHETHQLEVALSEAEYRVQSQDRRQTELKLAFDHARDSIFIIDPQTNKFVYVNAGAIRQLGYSEAELLAIEPQRISPVLAAESLVEFSCSSGDPEMAFTLRESTILPQNSPAVPVEVALQFCDDLGEHGRYVAIVRDISDRLEAEKKIRALDAGARAAHDAMLITDIRGVIQYLNPAFSNLFQINDDHAIGSTLWSVGENPDDHAFCRDLWDSLKQNERYTTRISRCQGDSTRFDENAERSSEIAWFDLSASPIKDESNLTTAIIIVLRDVTAEVIALAQREEMGKASELRARIGAALQSDDSLDERILQVLDELDALPGVHAERSLFIRPDYSQSGLPTAQTRGIHCIDLGHLYDIWQAVQMLPDIAFLEDFSVGCCKSQHSGIFECCHDQREHGHLVIPTRSLTCLQGIILLYTDSNHDQSHQRMDLLLQIGRMLGSAIEREETLQTTENARLRAEAAHQKIAEQQRELLAMEERLRLFVQHTPAAVAMFDRNMIYLAASRGWYHDYGLQDDVIGRNHYDVFEHIPDQWRKLHQQCLSGEPLSCQRDEFLGNDGQEMWLKWELQPWYDSHGEVGGLVIFTENITRQIEHERQLAAAKEAAEAASNTKSEFLANMSHEIRTPLTAIMGFADLLDSDDDVDLRHSAVATIKRNSEHLLAIINDILDLSKIEAGKMTTERIACSPQQVLEDVISLMQVRADAKGLALFLDTPQPLPATIESDPVRLRQILMNLTGNAIKFTETGSVTLKASTTTEADKTSLRVEVIDTGIGMTPEQAARLFQPFQQADDSITRKHGGTGLGLTISRRLAEILGGTLTLASEAGVGSTFTVTIDAGEVTAPAAQVNTHSPGSHSGSVDKPSLGDFKLDGVRVLLAEDGPDNQRLVRHFLRKAGATPTIANHGAEAVEMLGEPNDDPPFDIVLMDMQMPIMDGFTATRTLRSKGWTLPIIALTARAMDGDKDKCLEAGCDDFVSKPIDRIKLLQACAAALQPIQVAGH
jgi:PAS domain S-box-containing protein